MTTNSILERRLWPDGGYYLDNGASLCGYHHIAAEQTVLGCEEIREKAGIADILLPPHLYRDQEYDKWGNPVLASTAPTGPRWASTSGRTTSPPMVTGCMVTGCARS